MWEEADYYILETGAIRREWKDFSGMSGCSINWLDLFSECLKSSTYRSRIADHLHWFHLPCLFLSFESLRNLLCLFLLICEKEMTVVSIQWWAGKRLIPGSPRGRIHKAYFVVFIHFHGVNNSTMATFKLIQPDINWFTKFLKI